MKQQNLSDFVITSKHKCFDKTNYVVGKLKLDDIGNPSRKSKDIYYITNIIQIPEFQIFE
jgi:hypothetical protein